MNNVEFVIHSGRCANAIGSECECKCNYALHQIGSRAKHWPGLKKRVKLWLDSEKTQMQEVDIDLESKMGGEVGQIINQFQGRKHTCVCGHTMKISQFKGADSKSGFSDESGRIWCMYIKCDSCERIWQIAEKSP